MSLTRHPVLSSLVVADIGNIRSRVNFARVFELTWRLARDDGRPSLSMCYTLASETWINWCGYQTTVGRGHWTLRATTRERPLLTLFEVRTRATRALCKVPRTLSSVFAGRDTVSYLAILIEWPRARKWSVLSRRADQRVDGFLERDEIAPIINRARKRE